MAVKPFQTSARLFRNRNFSLYFAGRSISVIGDGFYSVALILAVLQSTHSVTSGATVLIAGTIPVIALTLIGGTLGDRFPRNRIMLASDLVRSATQFAMAVLLVHSAAPVWALIVTQLIYGAGAAFFDPASTGLLPDLVPSEDVPLANSALQLVSNCALVLGPALAGITIAITGAAPAIIVDAVSFLISALCLAFVSVPPVVSAGERPSAFVQLRTGFIELRKRRWVTITACYLGLLTFAFNAPIFVLGPVVALSRLGGAWAWSMLLTVFGSGLICGSLVALRVLRTRRPLVWAYLGNLAVVPLLLLLGTSHSVWLIAASSACAGVSVSIFAITYPTLLQQTIPKETLSRVGSYFWLARVAAAPLGLAIAGPLSARLGISTVFVIAASLLGIATIASVSFRDVWAVRAGAT